MLRCALLCSALPAAWMLACSGPSSGDPDHVAVPLYGGGATPEAAAGGAAGAAQAPVGSTGTASSPTSNPAGSGAEQGPLPGVIAQGGAPGAAAPGAMGSAGSAMLPGGQSAGAAGQTAGAAGSTNFPAAACPEPASFCDDFEDDTLGQFPGAPWQNQTGSGATVRVDGVQSFSGSRAVHVNAPPGQAYRRGYFSLLQNSSEIFPALSREMFGRAMFWLDATPNATVHWTLIQAEGRAANGTHDAYYRYGGQQQGGAGLMANYETNMGVSTDCYSHSATRMPTQNWTCVEWRFAVASNELQIWLNGSELTDLHVVDRPTTAGSGCLGNGVNGEWLAPPAFQTLHLGWEQYQQHTNDTNLWVDDVVLSSERVGCPPAR